MRLIGKGIGDLVRDVRSAGRRLMHDREAQIVTLLILSPWVAAIVVHRDPNVWAPLAEIGGIVLVYWFFTRGRPYVNLLVKRPIVESAVALAFVGGWVLYRIGQYAHLIVLPRIESSCCGDLTDTIIPKIVEMFLLPLVLFLFFRYSLGMLGLSLLVRAWMPALLPLLAFIVEGLVSHKPDALLTRTFSFYLGAGLAEEFLFRGLVQSRLESLVRRPVWGMFLGAFVFGLSHLPIDLYGSGLSHWQIALENAFTFQMGVGFALGFAFQRTRNLWPLTLIHALIDAAPLI